MHLRRCHAPPNLPGETWRSTWTPAWVWMGDRWVVGIILTWARAPGAEWCVHVQHPIPGGATQMHDEVWYLFDPQLIRPLDATPPAPPDTKPTPDPR